MRGIGRLEKKGEDKEGKRKQRKLGKEGGGRSEGVGKGRKRLRRLGQCGGRKIQRGGKLTGKLIGG